MSVTWTTRLRSNASLYQLAPPPTGKRGRPRLKGKKLPSLAELSEEPAFTEATVTRYGSTATISVAVFGCLWYGVFGAQEVQAVFVRDKKTSRYDIALITTDLDASAEAIVERYAERWSIAGAIEDAKQIGGVGEARNRVERAVERTAPFGIVVNSLVVYWYATVGHDPDDVEAARAIASWYRQKAQPTVLDMFAKLRRVIIATQFRREGPEPAVDFRNPPGAIGESGEIQKSLAGTPGRLAVTDRRILFYDQATGVLDLEFDRDHAEVAVDRDSIIVRDADGRVRFSHLEPSALHTPPEDPVMAPEQRHNYPPLRVCLRCGAEFTPLLQSDRCSDCGDVLVVSDESP